MIRVHVWLHVRYVAAERNLNVRTKGAEQMVTYGVRPPAQGLTSRDPPLPRLCGIEPFEGAPTSAALCRKMICVHVLLHVRYAAAERNLNVRTK
eukprot:11714830-Heterocapsa_arctica.AAC.1